MRIRAFLLLLAATLLPAAPPPLSAPSAFLLEPTTRTVLYEKQADLPHPAASLTKLVTAYLALQAVEDGLLQEDALLPVPSALARIPFPPDASLAGLAPGTTLTPAQLLSLTLIYSANDAAYALALLLAPDIPAFASRMNRLVHAMGYTHLFFEEPSGLSPRNTITAREIALFAADYLDRFPSAPARYHAPRALTVGGRTYLNRNTLLGRYPGLEGLKTGYLEESGFHIVAYARRGPTSLIAVLLGIQAPGYWEGMQERDRQAAALLDYGFDTYLTTEPPLTGIRPVRIWGGTHSTLTPRPARPLRVTLARTDLPRLSVEVEQVSERWAPLHPGERLGTVRLLLDGTVLAESSLIAPQHVPRAPFFPFLADLLSWIWHHLLAILGYAT
ncbi:peptidase S11 D-alanyl-D-alanine carboxypeptidase 1 [Spirochaeta thermophila DSM 6578]|uniref:serine-type D-Ala-D-Ala carboxypeptidase n=1 Tax=Winmispira thermophila (strain ATCC 700085 / DSM 6578 / Z-1203) TaxID=869211 RepID=G0GD35_WINT7|nr:D-alanyl-D-alanine carboxypeptidase family protein [Spirochaeta thermophila]AEJ62110.1 peptidase S11 D-alanyl-D-alanine carboxypeptidase 1 [Spirochaeta thermophila DSM 6578]